jgi:hypothetical protein
LPSEGLPTRFELLLDMLLAVGVLDYDEEGVVHER